MFRLEYGFIFSSCFVLILLLGIDFNIVLKKKRKLDE